MTASVRIPVLCLLLCAVLPAWAGPKEDIRAAMDKMLAVRSYHAEMTTQGRRPMTSTIDFAAPDRFRMTLPVGTQTIIGDSMIMNINGMHMKMPLPKGTLTKWRDPANMDKNMATMSATLLGADVVDGQPAKKYLISNTKPTPSESTLWIGASGYPLQIQVHGKGRDEAGVVTVHYSRFNDPTIKIEAQ